MGQVNKDKNQNQNKNHNNKIKEYTWEHGLISRSS